MIAIRDDYDAYLSKIKRGHTLFSRLSTFCLAARIRVVSHGDPWRLAETRLNAGGRAFPREVALPFPIKVTFFRELCDESPAVSSERCTHNSRH